MNYKIPLFKLNFDKKEEEAVLKTLRSQWISTGPKCDALEKKFAKMLNVKHAISLSSCTSSLHLALQVLGVTEGDEVICPSLTFAATVNSIKYVNAKPVFCDIESLEHLNISAEKIKPLITKKTKAIIVVHMAGFPAEMNKIMSLAKKNNLKVIEDACHGPLSEYDDKKLGTIGDIGCFSFFSNKNISTGEGGMLITNSSHIETKIRLLRSHGMTTMSYQRAKGHATTYDVVELGYNYRMDDIRASIGLVQLEKLKNDLELRKNVRKKYIELLSDFDEIIIPFIDNKEFVSNYIIPIIVKDSNFEKRDKIRELLHGSGIQTSVHYPSVHRFAIYNEYKSSLPLTEYVSDNEITLPMYSILTDKEIEYVYNKLKIALIETR